MSVFPSWVDALPTLSNGFKWDPGYPGGIPTGTVHTTLTGTPTIAQINTALANASTAATTAVNAAIAAGATIPEAIRAGSRVVVLPAMTSGTGTITARNYVTLRGNGATGASRTRLNLGAGGGVSSPDTAWGSVPLTTMSLAVGGSLPAGSTSVTVASATGFAVGDLIQLDQKDDLSYVWLYDAGYNKRAPFTDGPYHGPISPGVNGFRSVGSLHIVTQVNGTTLTFDPPTRMAYTYYSQADGTTQLTPQVWRVSRRGTDGVWGFGLEDLSIAGPQAGAIVYRPGAYNWIKGVETDGSLNGGITDDHIQFQHQFRTEIRKVYCHHTTGGPYSGGANYGINLNAYTSDCLVIDSISIRMNKPLQSNCCGPGNVIAYNYVDDTSANGGDWMDGAINGSHQAFSHMMLFEGNWSANLGCDSTHGNSGFLLWLRNYGHGRSSTYANNNNLRAANSDAFMREQSFIGNALNTVASGTRVYEATGPVSGGRYAIWSIGQGGDGGSGDAYDAQRTNPWPNTMNYSGTLWDGRTPTFTTKAAAKLNRHGNWDLLSAAVVWDGSNADHSIPNSAFLSAKPSFFGSMAWPPIDPTTFVGSTSATAESLSSSVIPAKARFDAGDPFADAPSGPTIGDVTYPTDTTWSVDVTGLTPGTTTTFYINSSTGESLTLDVTPDVSLSGTASGVGGATATVRRTNPLAGTAAGTGGGSARVGQAVAGAAGGVAGASGTLGSTVLTQPLAGSSAGHAGASAALGVQLPIPVATGIRAIRISTSGGDQVNLGTHAMRVTAADGTGAALGLAPTGFYGPTSGVTVALSGAAAGGAGAVATGPQVSVPLGGTAGGAGGAAAGTGQDRPLGGQAGGQGGAAGTLDQVGGEVSLRGEAGGQAGATATTNYQAWISGTAAGHAGAQLVSSSAAVQLSVLKGTALRLGVEGEQERLGLRGAAVALGIVHGRHGMAKVRAGDTLTIYVPVVKNALGQLVDLTGASLACSVELADATKVAASATYVDAATGTGRVVFSAGVTSLWPENTDANYDARMTLADGSIGTVMTGNFIILEPITP